MMRAWILEGLWPHAICSEDCTIEGDLGLPGLALGGVEDNAMVVCHPHKL